MTNNIKAHYTNLFKQHGRSPKAVQYVSSEDQFKRFDILCTHLTPTSSVIDLGCGLGDMLVYLRQNGFEGNYLGADFVDNFITKNKQHYAADQKAKFITFDMLKDKLPNGYDHIILSGVFNNVMKDNDAFMKIALKEMFDKAQLGISFNMLSTYVDFQDEELYYFDPLYIFDYCKKNLSKLITIKHDYGLGGHCFPYEFSVFIKKVQ